MRRSLMDRAIGVAPYALAILFIASWPWVLKGENRATTLLFQVAIVLVASMLAEAYREHRIDEVELAAVRFGTTWGTFVGMCVVILLTFMPSIQSLLVAVADWMDEPGNMSIERRLFIFGVTLTLILQLILRSLLTACWKLSKR